MEVSGQLQVPAPYPEEGVRRTNCIGGCVGRRACLDVMEKKKIPLAENRTPVVQPANQSCTDWGIPAPIFSPTSCFPHLEHRASVKSFVSLQFLNLTDSRYDSLDWGSALLQERYLNKTIKTSKRLGQTSTPRVGFEPMIPVFELAKTVHVSDRAASIEWVLFSVNIKCQK
jgi:hypothetical protein